MYCIYEKRFKILQDKRVIKTLDLIEATYLRLKCKEKRNKITVTDICAEARISRGTFYTYFLDIIDLESKVELKCVNNITNTLMQNYHFDGNYDDFLSVLLPYIKEHPYEAQLVLGKDASGTAYHAFCDSVSKKAMPQWLSRGKISPVKADILLKYIAAGIYSLLGSWIDQDIPIDEASFKQLYFDIGTKNIADIMY